MDENDIVYQNMLCYDYFRCTYIIGGNYMKNTILKIFNETYGERDDVRVFFSPGRVNLIGEYTDFI